jgi:hypothetical protein
VVARRVYTRILEFASTSAGRVARRVRPEPMALVMSEALMERRTVVSVEDRDEEVEVKSVMNGAEIFVFAMVMDDGMVEEMLPNAGSHYMSVSYSAG